MVADSAAGGPGQPWLWGAVHRGGALEGSGTDSP